MKMDIEPVHHSSPKKELSQNQLYGGSIKGYEVKEADKDQVFGWSSAAKRTEFNLGAGNGSQTSIKVHQAPGGNSNFSFGDDKGFEPVVPRN